MKILVIGGSGMLGHKLVQTWQDKFDVWTTIRTDYKEFEKFQIIEREKTIVNVDIENIKNVEEVVSKVSPDIIVNAAGIIKQLSTGKDIIKTLTINSIFPHQLADLAKKIGARLIIISTDCVFSGKRGDYSETDFADAYDLYGKSKYLGEVTTENCVTIRTSIIGRELATAHSLVEWFLSNRGNTVNGFVNAVFSGFPTIVLADIIAEIITAHPKIEGLYHISSEPINKFDLLQLIKEAYQLPIEIQPYEEFKIDRSLNSSKFRRETEFVPLEWREMIEIMAKDNAPYMKRK